MSLISRLQLAFLIVAILASVLLTYWNIMVRKDFVIINELEEASVEKEKEAP